MNTMTEKQTDTLTITAEALRELLAGAATQAHAKEDLPALNAVKIYSESGTGAARISGAATPQAASTEPMVTELSLLERMVRD